MWKAVIGAVMGVWIVAAGLIPETPMLNQWTDLVAGFLVVGAGLFMAGRHRSLGVLNVVLGAVVAITAIRPQSPQQLLFGGLTALVGVAAMLQYYRDTSRPNP